MINRTRPNLTTAESGTLTYYRNQVLKKVTAGLLAPVAADKSWDNFIKSKRSEVIKTKLINISDGICIYCEMSIGSTIDHFAPKSKFPYRTFYWSNLNWVCPRCNQDKGASYSQKLLNPMRDPEPSDRFVLNRRTGEFMPNPASSRMDQRRVAATIRTLGLNEGVMPLVRLNYVDDFLTDVRAFIAAPSQALEDALKRRFVGFGRMHLTAIRCCIKSVPLQPLITQWLAQSPGTRAELQRLGWI